MFSALAGTMWFLQFFFCGKGGEQIRKRSQFLDFAHGDDYFNSQLLGILLKRMDWSF